MKFFITKTCKVLRKLYFDNATVSCNYFKTLFDPKSKYNEFDAVYNTYILFLIRFPH